MQINTEKLILPARKQVKNKSV